MNFANYPSVIWEIGKATSDLPTLKVICRDLNKLMLQSIDGKNC